MPDALAAKRYQMLAAYFRSRQENVKRKAAKELLEIARCSQQSAGPDAVRLEPFHPLRSRYEYLEYEASRMGQEAALFEILMAKELQSSVAGMP